MERRTFVLSVGALAGGGSLALGTGAFSSVEAERDFDVAVSEDASAYLGIEPASGPNGNYANVTDNDTLAIDLTEENDNIGSGIAGGEGLNADAVTGILDVFTLRNQGTQEVEVDVDPLLFVDIGGTNAVLSVLFVPGPTSPQLAPGDEINYSLLAVVIDESAVDSVSISDEIEITAEEV